MRAETNESAGVDECRTETYQKKRSVGKWFEEILHEKCERETKK